MTPKRVVLYNLSQTKLIKIYSILKNILINETSLSFLILNPNMALSSTYAGTIITVNGENYFYRGYKAWTDLAEILQCKMLTPQIKHSPYVELTFQKLVQKDSFHTNNDGNKEEKYGLDSHFFEIQKMEEPAFLYYYIQALENVKLDKRVDILDLGINKADEFEVIKFLSTPDNYLEKNLVGIDHSSSAIRYAKERFSENNVSFYTIDINKISTLNLQKFDLIISIGTLQSPNIPFKPFFMSLVQNHIKEDAAFILGFPNTRWIGGEMLYGAKVPNYVMSELGLVLSDIIFCKKYLQQKKFRVTITGKNYLFLTATKIKL